MNSHSSALTEVIENLHTFHSENPLHFCLPPFLPGQYFYICIFKKWHLKMAHSSLHWDWSSTIKLLGRHDQIFASCPLVAGSSFQ